MKMRVPGIVMVTGKLYWLVFLHGEVYSLKNISVSMFG